MTVNQEERDTKERMAHVLPHRIYYESGRSSVAWLNRKRIGNCLSLAGNLEGKRILDAGVGDGYMLEHINCTDLWGIDISETRIERATRRVPHATLLREDLCRTGLDSNMFDGIICADVLEHIRTPALAVRELVRLCKPDGFIVICVPQEINNILARVVLFKRPILNPDHYHLVTGAWLRRQFGLRPRATMHIPDVPSLFCMHRVFRYDMEDYEKASKIRGDQPVRSRKGDEPEPR